MDRVEQIFTNYDANAENIQNKTDNKSNEKQNIRGFMNNGQINFEELSVKLKNNVSIHHESVMLLNFIENLLQNTSEKMVNRILMEVASVFCDLCLDDWWCSECLYHNRSIKINGKMVTP
eukprot:716160_1